MRGNINTTDLVDITSINVDKELPQSERRAEFRRQIKDIENFRCETMTIKAIYATDGKTMEDCFRGIKA